MNLSLAQIRSRYQEAVDDQEEARSLWRKLKDYRGEEGIILAYKAATRILMSNHSWMPMEKLAYLKEAMYIFRQAVRQAPDNPEVRFLRFSIEHNLPAYLNESGDMQADKAVILEQAPNFQDFALTAVDIDKMLDFFIKSGRFTSEELAPLQELTK